MYDATFQIISDKANQDRNIINIAEEAKEKHYNTKFNFPKHLKVIQLVIDSSGRWNGGLHEFVKKIARHTILIPMRNPIDHAKAVADRIAHLQQEIYRSR